MLYIWLSYIYMKVLNIKHKKCGWRVVWIGFWSCAPPHTSHSFASRERFQASERHIRCMTPNCATQLLLWQALTLAHVFCSLAHPNQVIPCEGNYWLLSQTFPEVIGGVTSTLHVTSTMSFLPLKKNRLTHCISSLLNNIVILIVVQIILNIVT